MMFVPRVGDKGPDSVIGPRRAQGPVSLIGGGDLVSGRCEGEDIVLSRGVS